MINIFKLWVDAKEVFISLRRTKLGLRYEFVHFQGVENPYHMERQLDSIVIENRKLHINISRFGNNPIPAQTVEQH